MGDPRALSRLSLATRQSLDGCDLAGANVGYGHRAGTQRLSIEKNGAGTALSHPTTEFRTRQVKIVTQDPKQGRVNLHLTGTKFGCGMAQCGACTVFLDGQPLRSCSMPVSDIGAGEITTIEGLTGREADAVKHAWIAHDVPQCGYCQSGQVMSATALLKEIKRPSDHDIDLAMNGNLCRCATYIRIRGAIHDAAKLLEG